jgi:hypothetical protein
MGSYPKIHCSDLLFHPRNLGLNRVTLYIGNSKCTCMLFHLAKEHAEHNFCVSRELSRIGLWAVVMRCYGDEAEYRTGYLADTSHVCMLLVPPPPADLNRVDCGTLFVFSVVNQERR